MKNESAILILKNEFEVCQHRHKKPGYLKTGFALQSH